MRRNRTATLLLLLLPAVATTGCDVPTDLPDWRTDWSLAFVSDTLATAHFLPEGVREEGAEFVVDDTREGRTVEVEEVCELCTCFAGPVPPLPLGPIDVRLPLPGGVVAVTLVAGTAEVTVRNRLPFDLLRDGEGGEGWLDLEVRHRVTGEVMDSVRFDDALPPGDSARFRVDLAGIEVTRDVVARLEGFTPGSGCDSIPLDPADGIDAGVHARGLRADGVSVVVPDAALRFDRTKLEVPEALSDRLREGEARGVLEIDVENRMSTAFDLDLSAAGSDADLFTPRAALHTPVSVAGGARTEASRARELFLLDLDPLEGTERVVVAGESRVRGSRIVEIRGGEGVVYRAWLHAELPVR